MAEMRLKPTFTIKAAFPVARTHSGTSGPLPSRTDNKAHASRASCCSLDLFSIISEPDPLDSAVVPLRGGAHVLGSPISYPIGAFRRPPVRGGDMRLACSGAPRISTELALEPASAVRERSEQSPC